ncbi:cytochrome P450 [Mycena rebaudengoi]|nr:cytochrome P450 [Mycena rebaudengoi]
MATCSKTPKSHTSLLMAGQHTSSAPLAWTMLHLASDTATADALYTEQDFRHLPLLDSCVRETLRMHPPIHSIMRQVREDVVVPASLSALFKDGVYVVPKDTYVLASPLVSQIDPQIWKDADKWNPTWWNDEQGVAAQALKTYTDEGGEKIDYGFGTVSKGTESPYQPFGAGKHSFLTSHLRAVHAAHRGHDRGHALCDALVPSILAEWSFAEGVDAACFAEPAPALFGVRDVVAASADGETEVDWARLDWEVDDVMREECMHAPAHVDALIAESDDDWFDEYGTAWINSARASPFPSSFFYSPSLYRDTETCVCDGSEAVAYIQTALQFAYFKSRGELMATYETALTRFMRESRAWQQTRRNPLHRTLTREAAMGAARAADHTAPAQRRAARTLRGPAVRAQPALDAEHQWPERRESVQEDWSPLPPVSPSNAPSVRD